MTLVLFAFFFLMMLIPVTLPLLGEAGVDVTEGSPIFMLFVMGGSMPILLIGFFCMYQGVVNAMRALADKPIRYALSIPFVK